MIPIRKILIANRGEIALRIMRTCHRMGISTVAVFSDADSDAAFVRAADEAVHIGPSPASQSYLDIGKILDAASLSGADAIHPGYGFLAENAGLARACRERKVTFIGPSPEVIDRLGSKREAKRIVSGAGVPVIPGYDGERQETAILAREAKAVGFPVLLKASAGGGGKGMRIVREENGLEDAIASAKRESKSAFGDDTLLIERYIDGPRHVEIQILGDEHGNLVHLFERECSIQRRHQKIIEETPSPAVSPELRDRMGAAAILVGQAVGYSNAGTVEFILDPEGEFYFLEVNTRLQVEHPVTECVTGLDLVREQIRVAQGASLELVQEDLSMDGAAIECRLYAEDPDREYLPTSGRIVDWSLADDEGLRVDTGITGPTEISIHYDPMLAKIICHAPTRGEAIEKLIYSLRKLSVQGIVTNREFLIRVLRHPQFLAGNFDTHFLETHESALRSGEGPPDRIRDAAVAATLADWADRRERRRILPALEPGFRNNPGADPFVEYAAEDGEIRVEYRNLGERRFRIAVADRAENVRIVSSDGFDLELEDERGLRRGWRVVRDGSRRHVQSLDGATTLVEIPRFPEADAADVQGGCIAPMPGAVVKVLVAEGQNVSRGEVVVLLEAMKMEHAVKASEEGTVRQVLVSEGDQVDSDQVLVVIDAEELGGEVGGENGGKDSAEAG